MVSFFFPLPLSILFTFIFALKFLHSAVILLIALHVEFLSCKASWYTMIALGSCKIKFYFCFSFHCIFLWFSFHFHFSLFLFHFIFILFLIFNLSLFLFHFIFMLFLIFNLSLLLFHFILNLFLIFNE